MRRGHSIPPRRAIFIGVEGPSDRAFVKFLGKVCESQGRHLHLYVKPANGGDSVAVIQSAAHHLSKSSSSREFHSIRMNDQWRLVFQWHEGHAYGVQIIDYH